MTIPYGSHYLATARGSIARVVHCDQCGNKFLYDMDRDAAGGGFSFLFLDNQNAERRAQTKAQKELQKKLDKDVDPIPCPSCGWYQRDMVRYLRNHFHIWMWYLGAVLLLCCGLMLPVSINTPITWPWALAAAGLFGGGGFGLIFLRRSMAAHFDPNATDLDLRLQKGRERSFRPEEWNKLLNVRQERQTALARSDAQSTYIPLIVIVVGFGLFAFGAAVWCLITGAGEVRNGEASLHWSKTEGKITRSAQIVEEPSKPNSKTANIQYSFMVEGKAYTSSQLWFGSYQKAVDNVAIFPLGKPVTVYFNPKDPTQSVLEPGAESRAYFNVVVGGIVMAIAVALFGIAYYLRCRYRKDLSLLWAPPPDQPG